MAPTPELPGTFKLRFKVQPGVMPGNADELTLEGGFTANTRVGQLRERLQEAIPSSPTPARQRLLYQGRALTDNDQSLADALNIRRDPSQDEYVLHLLIRDDGSATAPVPYRSGLHTENRPASPAAAAPRPASVPPQVLAHVQQPLNVQQPGQPQHAHALHHHHHQQALAMHQAAIQQHLQREAFNLYQQQQAMVHGAQIPAQQGHAVPVGFQLPAGYVLAAPAPFPQEQQGGPTTSQQASGHGQQGVSTGTLGSNPEGRENTQPPEARPEGQQAGEARAISPPQLHSSSQNARSPSPPQPRSVAASSYPQPGPDHRGQPSGSLQGPPRPVSEQGFHMEGVGPNGQRFTIHQQTLNFPVMANPGQPAPFAPHMMPQQFPPAGLPPLPGILQQHLPQPNRPSALDQARDNIAEMQRMLVELRELNTDDRGAQIDRLQARITAVNDYIDPMRLHGAGGGNGTRQPQFAATPVHGNIFQQQQLALLQRQRQLQHDMIQRQAHMQARQQQAAGTANSQSATTQGGDADWQARARDMRQTQQQQAGSTRSGTSDVTCYLLSSPAGPYAILYTPQMGTYTGHLLRQPLQSYPVDGVQPTPTTTVPQHGAQQGAPAAQNQGNAIQPAQAQDQVARPPNALIPEAIVNHMWLLVRVLVFTWFVLGTNMGWRRPLALVAIGLGFWMIRMGLLGDGGILRRWWEGIVNDGQPGPAAAQQQGAGPAQPGQQQNQNQIDNQAQQQGLGARPGQMPTPAEVAQRLLDEEARQRNAARDQRLQWLRERLRPVERAGALLVASLWPGVGEAYVRAREREERRRAEEEIAARRREELEKQKKEEEETAAAAAAAEGKDVTATSLEPAAAAGDASAQKSTAGDSAAT